MAHDRRTVIAALAGVFEEVLGATYVIDVAVSVDDSPDGQIGALAQLFDDGRTVALEGRVDDNDTVVGEKGGHVSEVREEDGAGSHLRYGLWIATEADNGA